MSLDVSSWFVEESQKQFLSPSRRFFIGGSDYSEKVLRWPKLRHQAGTIDLGTISLTLANRDRAFQFFVESDFSLTTSCEIALGLTHPESGEERVSLYVGEPGAVTFSKNGTEARLQLQGKTKRLTDSALGTDAESGGLNFTDSAYYPSDLLWTLVTCYGGLSTVESTSNPDMDYGKWLDWRELNVIRDVRVKGYFTGQKIFQVLNTLAMMDSMVILFKNAKLDFAPIIDAYGETTFSFNPKRIVDLRVRVDPTEVCNEFSVETDYDQTNRKFKTETTRVNSASQLAFGRRSGRFGSQAVWFDTLNDGKYLAEDMVRFRQAPEPLVFLRTPLGGGIHVTVGDVVSFTDSVFQLGDKEFRVVSQGFDLEQGSIDFELEPAKQRPWHFISFVSSLNLRLSTVTSVAGSILLATDETPNGNRVHRTDGNGFFRPLDSYGSAIVGITGSEVLFGGPPSSGSANSVIRRSSDAGSSSVTVSSLNPYLQEVFDLFKVTSAVFLASTNSGGIWRSADAGSSWNLTTTISPAYPIHRFFEPWSGTLWGGTGFDSALQTDGAYIWQSQDGGISWAQKHTIVGSGDYHVQGFYRIGDTEFLLSTQGSSINALRVFRSRYLSANSISWVPVLDRVGFREVVATSSGHLLFGFHEEITLNGGTTYRSLDSGSSWVEDARISKRGNLLLMQNGDGTVDALTARIAVGKRTDRHRNFDPNRTN